jgi:urease beta subunit
VNLEGFIPADTDTTVVIENPAFTTLYDSAELSKLTEEANGSAFYDASYKRHLAIPSATASDWLALLLWSNAPNKTVTVTVTNGSGAPITVTIDYSELTFNYTADKSITVASGKTLTVPTNAAVTISNSQKLNVNGTLVVNGTLTVNGELVAKGDVEGFTVNTSGKIDIASGGKVDIAPTNWANYMLLGKINAVKGAWLSFDGNNIVGNTGIDSTAANDTTFVLNDSRATISVTGTTYTIGGGKVSLKQFALWAG